MAKERRPLGLRPRKPLTEAIPKETIASKIKEKVIVEEKVIRAKPKPKPVAKKGRPSTKKGKKLVKYSMDIHPELKRAVVKAAAIYDKDVHVMWNEIIYGWFEKEQKKNPDWYKKIKVDKSEL